jgi:alpha-1,3-rhamnosyl/mannosyltransferase
MDAAAALSRVLGRPADEITTIAQGAAPIDAPAEPADVAGVRRRFGIEGDYLFALGRSDPRKNVTFLEDVMAEWRTREDSPPTLVVAGGGASRVFAPPRSAERRRGSPAPTGPSHEGVERAPRDAPSAITRGSRTVHVGRVDDETLRALYTGAAAFCFPSLAEGFGRPPLEALACGVPVVVAPYGPAREVLGDAAVTEALDVHAWVATLHRLVQGGPPPGFQERARGVVAAHRWEDGARATLELCARAAAVGRGLLHGRAARSVPEPGTRGVR